MNEDELEKGLKEAFGEAEGTPPPFDATWAMANARHARSGSWNKAAAGIAAAAVLGIAIVFLGLLPDQEAEMTDEFLIADALMNSTGWAAPSDALMPQHEFDIYREIPFPDPSTISEEGSLL